MLEAKGKCTIRVNAANFVAHVSIKDSDKVGVLYPGYTLGQPITVDKIDPQDTGVKYITVFNGNDYMGPI